MTKNDEVICISDDYAEEVLVRWTEHGVKHPIKDKIYTIRDVIKHSSQFLPDWIQEAIKKVNVKIEA